MNNIDFLKRFSYYSSIIKGHYICHKGYEHIQDLYRYAKDYGLTDEQREKFFTFVRCHNKEVHSRIREINKRLSHAEEAIYEDFDESELGDYAGRYCTGYERLISKEEEDSLICQLERLEKLIISFKDEVIKRDPVSRIPLIETLKKWRAYQEMLKNDTTNEADTKVNYNKNILRSLGNEYLDPSSAASPDDLP